MSIQFNGDVRLVMTWGASMAPSEFTATWIERVDDFTTTLGGNWAQQSLQDGNGFYGWAANDLSHPTLKLYGTMTDNAGHGGQQVLADGFALGTPLHMTLSFSGSNPSRCFFQVNDLRVRDDAWDDLTGTLKLTGNWKVGTQGSTTTTKVTMESLFLVDKALSDAEIEAFQHDPAGTVAAVTATNKWFYPFTGTIGTDVADGHPSISQTGDSAHSFTVAKDSGTVRYAETLVVQRPAVRRAYIGSSGDTITVCVSDPNGSESAFTSGQIAAMTPQPTIKINGNSPISLAAPGTDHVCHYGDYGAFFWLLPDGVGPLDPSDVVTISAPKGWVKSASGDVEAMVDFAVENCTGRFSADPSDGLMKLGFQSTTGGASIWNWGYWVANPVKWQEYGGDMWPDGTLKAPFPGGQNSIVFSHSATNYQDGFGYDPSPYWGLWALVWDDYDHSTPFTDMNLVTFASGNFVTEVEAYANVTVPETGERRVRVYDVQKSVWNLTLASGVDGSTATIPVNADPSPNWWGIPDAPKAILLTIGTEVVKAGGYDSGSHSFTGCTRGYGGTTAASHSSGASCLVTPTDNNFGLRVKSDHDVTHRYKNLRLYGPGNWTPPETPGPVTFGPEDPFELDSFFREHFVTPGCGVIRWMETHEAMVDGFSEPEDIVLASEQKWNYHPAHHKKLVFGRIEPFDSTGRYFYYSHKLPQFETYTATLVGGCDAIATSLTINRTTSEPDSRIPYGQILFLDDELVRVIGIPAPEGNVYTVARAQLGTTADSHSAGDFSVGWRLAITDESQYVMNSSSIGRAYHHGELFLDEAASEQPVRNGLFLSGRGTWSDPDTNVTARESFTLAADLAGNSSTLTITAGDWTWIKPGGFVTVNGEVMQVHTVNSGTGVVTVFGRAADEPDQTTGTAGTFTASGPLVTDGTTTYYSNLMYVDGPEMQVTGAASLLWRASANISFGDIHTPLAVATTQTFDAAKAVKPYQDHEACVPWSRHPPDFNAHICAESGADAWINFPYSASDALVYEVCKIYRDILPEGKKLHVALGNELWNWSISYLPITAHGGSWATGLGDGWGYHWMRSGRIGEVAKACWGETGRSADVLLTFEWQVGSLGAIDTQLGLLQGLGYDIPHPDVIADAPYTITSEDSAYYDTWKACSDGQAADLTQHDTTYGPALGPTYASAIAACDAIETRTGHRPLHCCYEGGDGDTGPLKAVPAGDGQVAECMSVAARTLDIMQNPVYRYVQRSQFEVFRKRGHVAAAALFCYDRPTQFSPNYRVYWNWGKLWTPNQEPGPGDGSDGGTNNTLFLRRQGQPNSVNPLLDSADQHNQSVIVQGIKDYQLANNTPTTTLIVVSDGVHLVITFPEAVTWEGGVVQLKVDGVIVGISPTPTGSGTTTLTWTLDDPVTGSAVIQMGDVDPGAIVTVEDGTLMGDSIAGADVTNQSTYTPGGGGGRRSNGAAMMVGRL